MPNMAKLLLFPKPAPVPIETIEQTITISFGGDTYAMTISAKIARVAAPPMDIPPSDFPVPVTTEPGPQPNRGARKSNTVPTEVPPANGAMQTAPAIQAPAPPATGEPAGGQPRLPLNPSSTAGATRAAVPEIVASVGTHVANVAPAGANVTKKATRTKKEATVVARPTLLVKPARRMRSPNC